MTLRPRSIRIVLVVVLVLGCLYVLAQNREPQYQGRSLSSWIKSVQSTYLLSIAGTPEQDAVFQLDSGRANDWIQARDAVRNIGADAIPYLLRWAQTKDSALKKKAIVWSIQHPRLSLGLVPEGEYHIRAVTGFRLLGNQSEPANPTLVQWTFSTNLDLKTSALDCLSESTTNREVLLPILLRLMHDTNRYVKARSCIMLDLKYPKDADAAGVYKMYPQLKDAPSPLPNR